MAAAAAQPETGTRALIAWGTLAATPIAILLLCAMIEPLPVFAFESPALFVLMAVCLAGVAISGGLLLLRRRRLAAAGSGETLVVDYPFELSLAFVAFWVAGIVLFALTVLAFVFKLGVVALLGRALVTAVLLYFFTATIGRTTATTALLLRTA